MPIKYFEWIIALRFLRSKRKDSFISVVGLFSVIGIILGVATLIVVMSVMKGFHNKFIANIIGIEGHITITRDYNPIENYQSLVNDLRTVDGVQFIAPLIRGQGMLTNDAVSSGVLVRGISPDDLLEKPLIKDSIIQDSQTEFVANKGVLLGSELARNLRLKKGDYVKLISSEGSSTAFGFMPRIKSYRVAGVFDVGLYQYNSSTMFMNMDDAQLFFRMQNTTSEIEVIALNPEKLEDLKLKIQQKLGDEYSITDWKMAQKVFLDSLDTERIVMFVILTLIIIVAAFNIISSLIMLVKDKTHNIAILRTIGATRESILKIFILCGMMIGIFGTFFGVTLGVIISLNIDTIKLFLESLSGSSFFDPMVYFLSKLPSELEFSNVLFVALLSLSLSLLATIYPARRAANMMPAEVMRNE